MKICMLEIHIALIYFLMESQGYSVFSNRTEKHTLTQFSYPLSHCHYCTKHQPPLLLQHVAISNRNIFKCDDKYIHVGSQGLWLVSAA